MSIFDGDPQGDIFLAAVRDFAIYNSIVGAVLVVLSYAATVLMNISAFNQVSSFIYCFIIIIMLIWVYCKIN